MVAVLPWFYVEPEMEGMSSVPKWADNLANKLGYLLQI